VHADLAWAGWIVLITYGAKAGCPVASSIAFAPSSGNVSCDWNFRSSGMPPEVIGSTLA